MAIIEIEDKKFETLIKETEIRAAIDVVAARMNNELDGKKPLFVCVLNGAFMFAADLMRRLTIDCQISFMKVASYEGTESFGRVKQLIGLNEEVKGRTVVLIEDIVDTGETMVMLTKQLKDLGAADVRIATLLFKPESCRKDVTPNYIGINLPKDFIVGYGLDYNGYGRNLTDIYTLVKD
jgi:hypoxanthine phosphoribosyltransferase